MGFQIERYNTNRVGLVVSFKNIPSSKDYCSSNNVEEAMEDALWIHIKKVDENTRSITLEGGTYHVDLGL